MIVNKLTSCSLLFYSWLQDHLLPCPFKYLTGMDCPGCGFQRSLIALSKGDIRQSFALYPPTIPLLLMAAWWLADNFLKLDNQKNIVKKSLFVIVGTIVAVSYIVKLTGV